jgi:peptide-methionine (S)-S-oxide reductase
LPTFEAGSVESGKVRVKVIVQSKIKNKVKGNGQECPFHTASLRSADSRGGCPHMFCAGGKTSETSFGFVTLMVRMRLKMGREGIMSRVSVRMVAMVLTVLAVTVACQAGGGAGAAVPAPAVDAAKAAAKGKETAVVAGGCFWGIQAVFQHVKGVRSATSGYSGGTVDHPDYETVSSGRTGHAESVEIVYDPSQVSYGELLRVFFSVALDPTELNRQGPDEGTQYRSVIFYGNEEQKRIAEAYIAQLDHAKVFSRPIVTQVVALQKFYPAEAYHQNFAMLHPNHPYIATYDAPKVADLKKEFPEMYAK